MTLGERIEDRRKAVGFKSQAALARQCGVGQSTMNGLIRNGYRWSPFLPRIARELGTTVEYLVGDIDDPDENVLPRPRETTVQYLMLPVALPNERALTRMFVGLLEAVDRSIPVDELAQELAELLPTALSALRGQLIEGPEPPEPQRSKVEEPAATLATVDHGSR